MENPRDDKLWRDFCAYWLLGLCNNFGYVVMLSAAHDIIGKYDAQQKTKSSADEIDIERDCHILSTGIILIADIIPSLTMKLIAPFVPYWMNVRVFLAVASAAAGFTLVAIAKTQNVTIIGVALTSAGCGLGESTFLAYSSNYNKNVVSAWSSGTGGAGIGASVSYASLKSFNVSHRAIMLIMLIIPTTEAIAFWIILRHPNQQIDKNKNDNVNINKTNDGDEEPLILFKDQLRYIVYLFRYILPLITVYICEYIMNAGLYELVYFENIFMDHASQYRWFNVSFQIASFMARSSVNIFSINRIWILSILEFLNLCYFLIESIYYVTPTIWITFFFAFSEGIVCGCAYVNTFYKLSKEISPVRLPFAISIVSLSDAVGITIAAFSSLPIHNAICKLPAPIR